MNNKIDSNCVYLYSIYFSFLDTYAQAKSFIARARYIHPVNYSEIDEPKRRPLNAKQRHFAKLKNEVKIKCERLTSLKRSICFLNRKSDRHKIENLDPNDVEEFDDLLSEDEIPENDQIELVSSLFASRNPTVSAQLVDDDVIELDARNNTTAMIRTGVSSDEIEVDLPFSLEYCYTKDVSNIHNHKLRYTQSNECLH